MKTLLNLICENLDDDTPQIVRDAMERMRKRHNEPIKPLMTKEEFEALPHHKKCILTCNVIGCGEVVSTHGMLCVEHKNEM